MDQPEPMYGWKPDEQKLAELILYISWRCEGDETFGATKLNKTLFFADFEAYRDLGHPITGVEYQCLDQGPAPTRLVPVREELRESGAMIIRDVDFFGRTQKKPISLRPPDLSLFTAEEIAIVDQIIWAWWRRSATEMSRASHEFIGWRLARPGETIPYASSLIEDNASAQVDLDLIGELNALSDDEVIALAR